MKKKIRTVVYDGEIRVEAYHFEGIARPFPNHFHEYYPKEVMLDLAEEVTGRRELPGFYGVHRKTSSRYGKNCISRIFGL